MQYRSPGVSYVTRFVNFNLIIFKAMTMQIHIPVGYVKIMLPNLLASCVDST